MRHTNVITADAPLVVTRPARGRHPLVPLLAHLRAPSIDGQLATGVEPRRTQTHEARARQLTRDRVRRNLARSLELLVEQVEDPPRLSLGAVVYPSRARVREARPLILTLASRLRSNAPVNPRGVAALRELLADGVGPVYTHGDPDALKRRLQTIDRWLDAQAVVGAQAV
jgi:hypothetical protein